MTKTTAHHHCMLRKKGDMINEKMSEMIEMILGMLKEMNGNDEFFEIIASMMRKFYDALLKEGFTEKQAIRIVAGIAARGGK